MGGKQPPVCLTSANEMPDTALQTPWPRPPLPAVAPHPTWSPIDQDSTGDLAMPATSPPSLPCLSLGFLERHLAWSLTPTPDAWLSPVLLPPAPSPLHRRHRSPWLQCHGRPSYNPSDRAGSGAYRAHGKHSAVGGEAVGEGRGVEARGRVLTSLFLWLFRVGIRRRRNGSGRPAPVQLPPGQAYLLALIHTAEIPE